MILWSWFDHLFVFFPHVREQSVAQRGRAAAPLWTSIRFDATGFLFWCAAHFLPVRLQRRGRNKDLFFMWLYLSERSRSRSGPSDACDAPRPLTHFCRSRAHFKVVIWLSDIFSLSSFSTCPHTHTHTHVRWCLFLKMRRGGQGWFLQQQCIIMPRPTRPHFSLKSRAIILIFLLHLQAFEAYYFFLFFKQFICVWIPDFYV